jgi:cell wall-associated NlpC family hydrolase
MKRLLQTLAALVLVAAIPGLSLAGTTHVVRKGDTLGKIARVHHVSVAKLKAANGLKGTRLVVGTKLAIPDAKARPKRRNARTKPGAQRTVRDAIPAELREPGSQVALADPQGSSSRPEPEGLPSEAELAEAAKAVDAASPAYDPTSEYPGAEETLKDRLLRVAQRMLSVPYRFGGTTLWGLDCSGFVQKAFAFLNRDLPRSAREQFEEGAAVEKANLSPGDLVFFRTYAKYPSHVGIYLGNNRFVHASAREKKVTIDSLETPYYVKRYIGAKRLLFEENDVRN